jgi:hypothetical protein
VGDGFCFLHGHNQAGLQSLICSKRMVEAVASSVSSLVFVSPFLLQSSSECLCGALQQREKVLKRRLHEGGNCDPSEVLKADLSLNFLCQNYLVRAERETGPSLQRGNFVNMLVRIRFLGCMSQ